MLFTDSMATSRLQHAFSGMHCLFNSFLLGAEIRIHLWPMSKLCKWAEENTEKAGERSGGDDQEKEKHGVEWSGKTHMMLTVCQQDVLKPPKLVGWFAFNILHNIFTLSIYDQQNLKVLFKDKMCTFAKLIWRPELTSVQDVHV